ncbi:sulfatase/phosphatase domain-containing protein, partial [Vibrio fujianensis]
ESTHVPLVIKMPKQTQGVEYTEAVSLLDVYPTITSLCGLPEVPSNEGLSLTPFINNPDFKRNKPAVMTWGYKNHAVRDERYRYIQYRDGSEELYDHNVDPNEHTNLANQSEYKGVIEKLKVWIPTKNRLPYGMEDFKQGDFLEKHLREWEQNDVPDFLS